MPTPMWVFAEVAAKHGKVDPNDEQAIDRFYEQLGGSDASFQQEVFDELIGSVGRDDGTTGVLVTSDVAKQWPGRRYAVIRFIQSSIVVCLIVSASSVDKELVLVLSEGILPRLVVGSTITISSDPISHDAQLIEFAEGLIETESDRLVAKCSELL